MDGTTKPEEAAMTKIKSDASTVRLADGTTVEVERYSEALRMAVADRTAVVVMPPKSGKLVSGGPGDPGRDVETPGHEVVIERRYRGWGWNARLRCTCGFEIDWRDEHGGNGQGWNAVSHLHHVTWPAERVLSPWSCSDEAWAVQAASRGIAAERPDVTA